MHIRIVHEEVKDARQRNYKCESCGISLNRSDILKNHIKRVHEGQRNYKCDSCGKSYTQAHNLKMHIKTVHDG